MNERSPLKFLLVLGILIFGDLFYSFLTGNNFRNKPIIWVTTAIILWLMVIHDTEEMSENMTESNNTTESNTTESNNSSPTLKRDYAYYGILLGSMLYIPSNVLLCYYMYLPFVAALYNITFGVLITSLASLFSFLILG